MDTILIIAICAINVAAFYLGAKIGQKVANGNEVKLPTLNPVQANKERLSRKEAERQSIRDNIIMANIDRYDGTSYGQEDVPKE